MGGREEKMSQSHKQAVAVVVVECVCVCVHVRECVCDVAKEVGSSNAGSGTGCLTDKTAVGVEARYAPPPQPLTHST